jgi:lysozyme family protein
MEPKRLLQTRLYRGQAKEERGNCLPAVIACFLHLDSAEDAIQIQEYYDRDDWHIFLFEWLNGRGWDMGTMPSHVYDNTFYLVSGLSPRGVNHICIYQNGKLWHDPHPSGDGIKTEEYFEYLEPLTLKVANE